MAGITQTIPNYLGGISEQPDQLKVPGQVKSTLNSIPDVVKGLYKRPGAKRIGTDKLAAGGTAIPSGGSWFHYYRDEVEGSYIGQVASNGKVRMWSCKDGTEKNVWYHTDNTAWLSGNSNHTSITNYLTPNPSTDTEDIQALTINDTTFLVNRAITVTTTGTTTGRPHKNFAYIELARSENGRQYSLNIYDDESTQNISTATRLEIESDNLEEGGGTGHCPGIGTQVFNIGGRLNTNITIQNGGSGYTSAPSIGFGSVAEPGVAATASATLNSSGSITAITMTELGSGYTSAPDITFNNEWQGPGNAVDNGQQWFYGNNLYTSTSSNNTQTGSTPPTHTSGSVSDGGVTWAYAGTPASAVCSLDTTRSNLVFRISALGQQGVNPAATNVNSGNDYRCSYNREITLLHGGEGWTTGDTLSVILNQAQSSYQYKVKVTGHEAPGITSNIKAVRPEPTPFDADTAVTIGAILGGIASEISGSTVNGNPVKTKIVGNGIYVYTENDADDFNVEVVDQDLMRVMQTEVNDVATLPFQCVDGVIVKIANTRASDEDDYYVKFNGENGLDGPGSWQECAQPGIVKSLNAATMPHIIQRQADGDFLLKQYTWSDRDVGDDVTNPIPSFADGSSKINKVVFFRNRLTFLSGENVITSRPGTIAEPNFWSDTALTVSAVDPIDISCASNYPSDLYDAIEITSGLLCFSDNAQFLLASDDTLLNPDTAKLRAVSWYNYNKVIPPVSLGQTIGWIDNSHKYSRFVEIANVLREGEPLIQDTSTIVPTLIPKDIDLFTNSRENNLVFFGKTDSETVLGYRYVRTGKEQIQSAWFKWKFNNPLKYHFIINDQYFFLDKDNFLQSINLVQADTDPSIDQDSINYLLHLDNYGTVAGGTYNSTTKLTTFAHNSNGCNIAFLPNVTANSDDGKLVIVDSNSNSTRVGRYAIPTIASDKASFTVPGNWSGATLNIGYLYEYNVEFPRIYLQKAGDNTVQSDVNSKLTVHRIKLNFGKIGLYETSLVRVGKSTYTEVYESTDLDEYSVSDAPYLDEKIKDIPVYESNKNVDITLKSSHPAPAILRSMTWEGDWTPQHYRRV